MRKCAWILLLAAVLGRAQAPSAEAIFKKAIALQAAGDAEGAVREYTEYLRLVPGRVEAISNLGAALARLGRMEEAIRQYKLALSKEPRNPGVRLNLALAYYKMGQTPAAITELKALHQAYPTQQRVAELLADCYLRQEEFQSVIDLLMPFEAANSQDRGIAYMMGIALLREKRIKEGARIIDRLFREGDTAEMHLLLGTTKLASNEFIAAKEEFARAVQLNPKLPGIYSMYGDTLREVGDQDGAVEAYTKALEIDPTDFQANLYIGARYRVDQNYGEALKYLERARQVQPDSPAVQYQVGAVHLGQGKVQQAAQELETLIKRWPTFLQAHVSLASAYYRLKRKDDADRERDIVRTLKAEAQAREAKEPASSSAPPKPLPPQ